MQAEFKQILCPANMYTNFLSAQTKLSRSGIASSSQLKDKQAHKKEQQLSRLIEVCVSSLFSAGKSEVSAIFVYKAGECMQELLKSWKESEATPDAKNAENQQNGTIC